MTTTPHTKPPFVLRMDRIFGPNNVVIASIYWGPNFSNVSRTDDEVQTDAEFLVLAMNYHDELIAMLLKLSLEAMHYRDAKTGERFLTETIDEASALLGSIKKASEAS